MNDATRRKYCHACRKAKKDKHCATCAYGDPGQWQNPNEGKQGDDVISGSEVHAALAYIGEENEEAWDLWQFVQGQWRMSFGEPVALDYGMIFQVAPVMEIELTRPLLLKIKALEQASLKRMQEKAPTTKGAKHTK